MGGGVLSCLVSPLESRCAYSRAAELREASRQTKKRRGEAQFPSWVTPGCLQVRGVCVGGVSFILKLCFVYFVSHRLKKQIRYGSLKENGPQCPIGSSTIRRNVHVGEDVSLLEEVLTGDSL